MTHQLCLHEALNKRSFAFNLRLTCNNIYSEYTNFFLSISVGMSYIREGDIKYLPFSSKFRFRLSSK